MNVHILGDPVDFSGNVAFVISLKYCMYMSAIAGNNGGLIAKPTPCQYTYLEICYVHTDCQHICHILCCVFFYRVVQF